MTTVETFTEELRRGRQENITHTHDYNRSHNQKLERFTKTFCGAEVLQTRSDYQGNGVSYHALNGYVIQTEYMGPGCTAEAVILDGANGNAIEYLHCVGLKRAIAWVKEKSMEKEFIIAKADTQNGMVHIQVCRKVEGRPRPIVCTEALAWPQDVDAVTEDLLDEAKEYFSSSLGTTIVSSF